MKPSRRAALNALFGATFMASAFVGWMMWQFDVGFSRVHAVIFILVWFMSAGACWKSNLEIEALRYMDRDRKPED